MCSLSMRAHAHLTVAHRDDFDQRSRVDEITFGTRVDTAAVKANVSRRSQRRHRFADRANSRSVIGIRRRLCLLIGARGIFCAEHHASTEPRFRGHLQRKHEHEWRGDCIEREQDHPRGRVIHEA